MGEFLLPYDAVRTAKAPDTALLEFLQSTYKAAANAGDWDRAALETALEKWVSRAQLRTEQTDQGLSFEEQLDKRNPDVFLGFP